MNEMSDLLEKDLELIGCSAIEDKLQKNVPEMIELLLKAQIRLFMLTGDKPETALNIATAAGLLRDEKTILILTESEKEQAIEGLYTAIQFKNVNHEHKKIVLLIDGKSLGYVTDPAYVLEFMDLVRSCESVICARVAPIQKVGMSADFTSLKLNLTLSL
jgi:phospholipid-transporting ATPase